MIARGDLRGQRLDHGDGDVAGRRLRLDQRGDDRIALGLAGLGDARLRRSAMITPTAASARASAASKSSMRCSRARSLMMARIAALA